MKSFPRSCKVARAWAVALPETVDTSFPGLKPPMLDTSGDERLGVLRMHQTGGGRGGKGPHQHDQLIRSPQRGGVGGKGIMNSHEGRVDHGAPVRVLSNFRTEAHEPSAGNLKNQSRLVHVWRRLR